MRPFRGSGGYQHGPQASIPVSVAPEGRGLPELRNPHAIPPNHEAAGGREPKESFVDSLRCHAPEMVVFWNRFIERWVIWRCADFQDPTLVMVVENPNTHEYWDLDNRVLAFLYDSDPETYGGLKGYWNFVNKKMDLANERKQARWRQRCAEAMHAARLHTKIRVGYGYSPGDKAAMHSTGWEGEAPRIE